MEVSVQVVPNPKTMAGLKVLPDRVMYQIARQTLEMARSVLIPKSPAGTKTSGNLRTSSMAGGVQGSSGNYYIGSYTSYASYVWNMPDSTNWSFTGSGNKWYTRTLKKHGKTITETAINRGWSESM